MSEEFKAARTTEISVLEVSGQNIILQLSTLIFSLSNHLIENGTELGTHRHLMCSYY